MKKILLAAVLLLSGFIQGMASKLTIEAVEDHTPNQSFREAGGGLQISFSYAPHKNIQSYRVGGPKYYRNPMRPTKDFDFGKIDMEPYIYGEVFYLRIWVSPTLATVQFPSVEMKIPVEGVHPHHYKIKIIVKEFSLESKIAKVLILGGPEDV